MKQETPQAATTPHQQPGINARRLAEIIGGKHAGLVYPLEHDAEWNFGTHWHWRGGEMVYLPEGLAVIAEALFLADLKGEALALRTVIKELRERDAAPGGGLEELPARHGSTETTTEKEFRLKRWDLQHEAKQEGER